MAVEYLEVIVLAKLERRVEVFEYPNTILGLEQADTLQTPADIPLHVKSGDRRLHIPLPQNPVDASERFGGRKIQAMDPGEIQDQEPDGPSIEGFLFNQPSHGVLDIDYRSEEQIAREFNDERLLPGLP